jgi:hypothetical protein
LFIEEVLPIKKAIFWIAIFISYYIFGLIFLKKSKWILKLIVPLITVLVSYGIMWSGMKIYRFCKVGVDWDMIFVYIPAIILVWEIAYQILKRIKMESNAVESEK